MIEKNYSIHGIVNFKVIANNISKRMDIEYKNFESNNIDNPDFIVQLGDFKPLNDNCIIIDNKYHIKQNYFYCEDSYKMGKWEVEISGFGQKFTKVMISVNRIASMAADMFICAFITDFLIRFKLEEKGYSVVHASAVSKDGHAYLFPSHSGAGKTTTALYFAEIGYDFLGDDFVIIHEGNLISYLTPLNIFAYNLNSVVSSYIGKKDKYLLKLKSIIYDASFGYVKIFTKVNPTDMFLGYMLYSSSLDSVYLLAQRDNFNIRKIDTQAVVNNLFINQMLEAGNFLKYILEYSYVFPESNVAKFWNNCKTNLETNLGNHAGLYEVSVPKRYDRETFNKMRRIVECGI